MDVITCTTFHLQVRIRSGTDDQAETGPDRVDNDSGLGLVNLTGVLNLPRFSTQDQRF